MGYWCTTHQTLVKSKHVLKYVLLLICVYLLVTTAAAGLKTGFQHLQVHYEDSQRNRPQVTPCGRVVLLRTGEKLFVYELHWKWNKTFIYSENQLRLVLHSISFVICVMFQ